MIKKLLLFVYLLPNIVMAQYMTINEGYTVQELIEDILINSSCAEVSNFTSFTGTAVGINGIGAFNAAGTDFPFINGIVLTSGRVDRVPGPNNSLLSDGSTAWVGDPYLSAMIGGTTNN